MSDTIVSGAIAPAPTRPRLLDVLRDTAQRQGYSQRTIAAFVSWVKMYVRFHQPRHPRQMQVGDVARFLEWVGRTAPDPLIAIEEARTCLEFLYHEVLCRDLGELPRPQPPRLLDQVRQVLRVRHYARTTEDCYADWIKRFIATTFVPSRLDGWYKRGNVNCHLWPLCCSA